MRGHTDKVCITASRLLSRTGTAVTSKAHGSQKSQGRSGVGGIRKRTQASRTVKSRGSLLSKEIRCRAGRTTGSMLRSCPNVRPDPGFCSNQNAKSPIRRQGFLLALCRVADGGPLATAKYLRAGRQNSCSTGLCNGLCSKSNPLAMRLLVHIVADEDPMAKHARASSRQRPRVPCLYRQWQKLERTCENFQRHTLRCEKS